ncbi:MAG: hypothetical protein N2505_04730 [Endomicrobia bacterium]|nr:hypothetical protein [Endomicrobiia bacterium]
MAKYYCKYCGTFASTVSSLTSGTCPRNPVKGGRHVLYEGSEKSQYVCKYCGTKGSSISSLTSGTCPRHPAKGKHEPAL